MGVYDEHCRGAAHSSTETAGLLCDGKPCFEVIESGKMVKKVKYWCCSAHQHFDPRDEGWTCPRGFSGTGGGKF